MYASLKKERKQPISKKLIIALLVSVSLLSLLDLTFNFMSMGKGSFFSALWLLASFVLVYSAFFQINDFKISDYYFRFTFTLFICYGFVTVLRGWTFSKVDLTTFLRDPYIFWPFFIPLFVYFKKILPSFGFMLKCFYYWGFAFLFIALVSPSLLLQLRTAELFVYPFAIGSGFLLMNSIYLNNIKINISFLVLIVSTLSFIFLARRAGLFILVSLIFSSYALVMFKKNKPVLFKLLPVVGVILIAVFVSSSNYTEVLLAKINERLFEDTRSIVFDLYFEDMKNSMVFGKGMNGTYYCPIGGGLLEDGIEYELTYYRQGIENGYLQLMLSGGITHVVLFLMVVIPAGLKGIFRSSNQFTKSCGIMIFIWLVYMMGSGLPSLSLGYILFWLCVGVCYRKSIRLKTDEEIKKIFRLTREIPELTDNIEQNETL